MPATNKQFTVDSNSKLFSGEISTIQGFDKKDGKIGVELTSSRTGAVSFFVIATAHKYDGDIAYWKLVPSAETLVQHPGLTGWTMRVWND